MQYYLAQINIAQIRAPLDSEIMHGFTSALEEINALAEASPGFVWRLKTPAGDATSLRVFPDPRVIVNMSVWTDVPALKAYVFRSMHGRFFARRAEWFEKMDTPHLALWWLPEGELPTLDDAKARLASVAARGDTDQAFTFRTAFPPPGASTSAS
jgi:hypothetical protein